MLFAKPIVNVMKTIQFLKCSKIILTSKFNLRRPNPY